MPDSSTPFTSGEFWLADRDGQKGQVLSSADAGDTHDQGFWPEILAALQAGVLLIFDLGYTNFHVFAQLTTASGSSKNNSAD
ncbi:MAG: hypothetical protein HYR70_07445 [Chloroflexi bacterium]|nr:hypothetical protein [Chloroflexota bacterium]